MKVEGTFKDFFIKFTRIVKGQEDTLALVLSGFLARGHVLLEGPPGIGKTTFSLLFSMLLGLEFKRLQGTSDILPADITGAYVPSKDKNGFEFFKGPVFTDILLVDEINRMNPRAQSALLEAMEERQVTVEGKTHGLSGVFFVIATQNPLESHGTYPLPSSQLDRFILKIEIKRVDRYLEQIIVRENAAREKIEKLDPVFSRDRVFDFFKMVTNIKLNKDVEEYIFSLVDITRKHPAFMEELSTRAVIHLFSLAKAHAFVMGREYVVPDDVKRVFKSAVSHRVAPNLPSKEKALYLDEIERSVKPPL